MITGLKTEDNSDLFSYIQETDKATMDVEAQDEGKIAKIIVGSFLLSKICLKQLIHLFFCLFP